MKVKAIKNIIEAKDAKEYITIGKEYNVYGILNACWSDSPYPTYIIWCDKDKIDLVSADYFEVVDTKFSKYWVLEYGYRGASKEKQNKYMYLLHKRWLEDPEYLEWLVDATEPLKDFVFKETKNEMDDEYIKKIIYQDKTVELQAEALDDSWVLCPKCNEAWKTDKYTGVITCMNCNAILNNPYAPENPKDI